MTRKRTRPEPAYARPIFRAPEPPQPPQEAIAVSSPPTPQPTGSLTAAEKDIIQRRYFEQKAFDQLVIDHNERALLELGKKLKALDRKD